MCGGEPTSSSYSCINTSNRELLRDVTGKERGEGDRYGFSNPGPADMTETFFAANKVDRGPDWQQVNNDRANLIDHASREGPQDRDAMTLYHSTPDCSLEVAYMP